MLRKVLLGRLSWCGRFADELHHKLTNNLRTSAINGCNICNDSSNNGYKINPAWIKIKNNMMWYAFWSIGAQCRLQEAHSRWKDFTFGGFVESNMDGRRKCKNPARRCPKWTKMQSTWIHNPTKPFEIRNKLLKICKIQTEIKQNVIFNVLGGRGAQGRRKDAHSRWGDCTFFARFNENCRPMVDLGSHFGSPIGPKTMQKNILK